MKRNASAQWNGDLKSGKGTVSTASGGISNLPYSFSTRFGDEKGTNPEELVGAAHAGCFSMALSAQLTNAGTPPEQIDTTATVTMDKDDTGWKVSAVHLEVVAKVPGASKDAFDTAAQGAKKNCPISRLFNAEITMDAKLA